MAGRIAGFPERQQAALEYTQAKAAREAIFREKKLPIMPQDRLIIPEPGVVLKQQFKKRKGSDNPRDGKYIDFTIYDDVPMQDWDFPDAIHDVSSVNIRHAGDAIERVQRFVHDNPDSRFRMYLTPGGVRSFDMTRQLTPRDFAQRRYNDILEVDPNYIELAQQLPPTYGAESFMPEQGWGARTSGKPGRENDFVAFHIGNIGKAPKNPENARLIHTYHDLPIARSVAAEGMNPKRLPESGIQLLANQVQTIDRPIADQIKRNMASLGIYL